MSVAVLYEANEAQFNTFGLGPLKESESCLVTEERNGVFELSLDYPVTGQLFKELKNTRIIKAHAGPSLRDQRFRINRVSKVFTKNGKKYVTIYAEHVSYITQELAMLPEVHVVTLNAYEALRVWKSAILDENSLTVYSDIATIGSAFWHIREVTNPRMALGGVSGSMLDVYGGEYKFDNYTISLLKQRGKKANTIIKYGRNLTDLTQDEYINTTYTSVYPYAIYTDEQQKETLVRVSGYVVDSEHVNRYPNRKILPLDFSSEFDQNNLPTSEKLLSLAKSYIKSNNVGVPRVSIKLEYIDLSQTLDYKDLAVFEEINLCDELPVYFNEMDIQTTAKVVRVVWDNIMDRYETIELGETKTTLSNVINTIETNVNNVQTTVNEVQLAANGKNTVFRGPDQPTAQKVGDMWYKPNGDETEFYIWNGTVWEFVMSTKEVTDAKETADQAQKEAKEATDKANQGVEKANQSIEEAKFAKDIAGSAKVIANQATANANQSRKEAKEAIALYENLDISTRNIAANTKSLIKVRNVSFSTLIPIKEKTFYSLTAKIILPKKARIMIYINDDKGTSRPARTTFFDGELPAGESIISKTVKTTTDGNKTTQKVFLRFYALNDATLNFTVAEAMLVESDKPVPWLPAPEDVQVQLTNINGELSQKVSQIQFNTLDSTVKNQATQISQNKTDISLKANQSEVNTLTGRVSSTESKLTVQSEKISGLVTKTDGQATEIANLVITAKGLNNTVSKVQTELTNLSVGGRNYQKKTSSEFRTAVFAGWNFYTNNNDPIKNIEEGTNIAVKAYLKPQNQHTAIRLICKDINGAIFELGDSNYINAGKEGYAKFYVKMPKYATEIKIVLRHNKGNIPSDACLYKEVKLEIGTKATDWSPAPEDMATQVEFSNLQQTVTGIQTTVAGKANQSQITQLSNQITSVVKDVGQVDLKTRIAGGLVLSPDPEFRKGLNELLVYNNARNAAVTVIRESVVDGSQPTGNPYRLKIQTTAAASPTWGGIMRLTMSRINAEFVVRFTALLPIGREFRPANNSLGNNATVKWITPNVGTGSWKEYMYHVKCGDAGTFSSFGHIYVASGGTPTTTNPLVWYLARYEMIDITQSNQSQITQLTNQINLRVTQAQVNESILNDKTVKDTRNDNQLPSWYWNTYPKQLVQEFKHNQVIELPVATEGKFSQLETVIPWYDISGGPIKQVAKTDKSMWQRFSTSKTTWGIWNKIADTSNVVNQINISTEGILIAGNKVQITGQTYIQDAVIQSSKIASVVADKIKAGTLNAALVNIINLNANNISSGYLDSNRIKAKSITADKLTADAIQVGFNAMGNTMKINSLSLSFYTASILTGRLTGSGMEYWYGNRKVGSTGEASKSNNMNVRGISNSLETTGDFITWSYKKNSMDISFTPMLTLDPRGAFTGTSGIHVNQDLYCNANIGIRGAYQNLKFGVAKFNNVFFPALTNAGAQAGILFGASELYLMKSNKVWSLTKIVNLVDKLSGMGSIAIARSFGRDGTANSWSTLTI